MKKEISFSSIANIVALLGMVFSLVVGFASFSDHDLFGVYTAISGFMGSLVLGCLAEIGQRLKA